MTSSRFSHDAASDDDLPPTPCDWCGDDVAWDDPDRREVNGNVYCCEKCAGKVDHHGEWDD